LEHDKVVFYGVSLCGLTEGTHVLGKQSEGRKGNQGKWSRERNKLRRRNSSRWRREREIKRRGRRR
jgi:hypothetical protein